MTVENRDITIPKLKELIINEDSYNKRFFYCGKRWD